MGNDDRLHGDEVPCHGDDDRPHGDKPANKWKKVRFTFKKKNIRTLSSPNLLIVK